MVLPGAELQLLDSLYATDFARQLARDSLSGRIGGGGPLSLLTPEAIWT